MTAHGGSPLDGVAVLVAGGTGNVGRAIVTGLVHSGATVVVPSRSAAKLAALRAVQTAAGADRLITIPGDISNEQQAAEIRHEALARVTRLDAVVASLGSFVAAPSVLAEPRAALEHVLADYLLAHFVVARTFLPLFTSTPGTYLLINGPLAFAPAPGSGLVSIATAGQAMLADTLIEETAHTSARVNELVIHLGIGWGSPEETRRNGERVAGAVATIIVDGTSGTRLHVSASEG